MRLIGTPRSCNNVTVITMQQPQPTKLSVSWQSLAIGGEKSRRSAPFSEPVGWYHQSLLGYRSRHCYGINFANNGLDRAFMIIISISSD
jgi:hypothetical protein